MSPLKGKDDDGNSGEFADLTEDDEKALVEQFEKEQDGLSFLFLLMEKIKLALNRSILNIHLTEMKKDALS